MRNRIIGIFLLFPIFGNAQESDVFSPTNTAIYAEYLYNTGNYSLAIPEYNRLLFFEDSNFEDHFRLIKCYRHTQNYSLAISHMDKLFNDINLMMPQSFANEYIHCNILMKNYERSLYLMSDSGFRNVYNKPFYLGLTYIMVEQYDKAEETLEQNPLLLDPNLRLKAALQYYKNEKTKSPVLAIAMSSIVPGSGKVYTGNWKDGLIAFSFVTVSAWQSYRGFHKNGIKSAYGWIYGIASISFYIGNLYGSGKAANMYNIRKKEQFQHHVQDIFMDSID